MQRGQKSQRGLTVVELLVVTVVVGILGLMSLATFASALERSRQRATMADMRSISKAIEIYCLDNSGTPDDVAGIQSLVSALRPYSNDDLPVADRWGNPYNYLAADTGQSYTLESFGKDGRDGQDYSPESRSDFDRDLILYNGIFTAAPD
ncbi:MAG: prepilin-type N-terminal cleavage/methylation domain-containing protein [bacterium]|nr:prepilin-type N-terminal cleavage/methylation domain-containing protein [bacterium]